MLYFRKADPTPRPESVSVTPIKSEPTAEKAILFLALIALCFGQRTGFRPFPIPSGTFNGTSSFGASTSTSLVSFAVAAGGISSSGVTSIGVGGFATIGLTVEFTVSSSAAGSVNVTLNNFVGGSLNSFTGVSSSGGVGGSAAAGVSAYFGFTVNTTLAPGQFQINATIRPSATAVLPTISANLQLFYSASATDGSNAAYSNGAYRGYFFGALPSSVSYNGTAVSAITFNLPAVQSSTTVAANVDLTVGISANTVPVFPVLYGTAARVVGGARALYVFSVQFALSLYNAANTTVTTTANNTYNSQATITAGTSTTYGASGSFGGYTYNSTNTVYAGVSYTVSVQQQVTLASQLVYNTSNLALTTGSRFVWAFYNDSSATAQILTDSLYDPISATVSVNVTHFSTYAVYQTADTNNSTTSSTSSSTSSSAAGASSTTASVINTNTRPSGSASAITLAFAVAVAAMALAF